MYVYCSINSPCSLLFSHSLTAELVTTVCVCVRQVALAGSSYQLAVLAPVHREGADMFRCGPLADTETLVGVAAAAWTVAASRLPVGARVLDTCGRPERARDQLFSLLSSAAADPRRLLGVLSLSEPAGAAVAGMLRQAGVPHVWLPLTGHGGAYDRLVGPYRAVPPVELEVHAVVSLARQFGWRQLLSLKNQALTRRPMLAHFVQTVAVAGREKRPIF